MKLTPIFAAMLLLSAPAQAQQSEAAEETFIRYCASCHGIEGRGNGPMSAVLTVLPSDLTTLAQRHDGVFPRFRVIARIDGRDPLVAHGSPMPVYGDFFEGKGVAVRVETGELVMTSQPIVDLLGYLEAIQE